MNDITYTCEQCKNTYTKIRSDEDCMKEMMEIMPEAADDEIAVLCDECWIDFMRWFKSLSVEQKMKMRDEFENRCQKCNGHKEYYIEAAFFDEPILVKCEDCKCQ